MEDLDNKLANALEAIKNQAPVPIPSKGKAKGHTAKAAPAPAVAQVPVAAAADVSPPADKTSSDTDTGGVTPLALQHDDEISHKHDASASTKGRVKEQHNKEHASAHSTHAGAGSLIRLRTQSQDLNPKIMGKDIPAPMASPNTNTVARRTCLIDNLDSETVDFTSTYESRHISPSPNLRLARERSRSRSSSVDTGTSLLGAGTSSGLGVSPLHTSSTAADVTNGPPTFDDEPISLTQHNHYVGTNEVDRDHIHAVYDLGRAVGTGEAAGIVDVQGNHLTAGEAAEIISENAYKRRIGDALTQQLLQQMGALPKAKPWSLDRADAPPSTARDSYVPDHRHSAHKTDNIQVVMRVRPLFKDEVATGTRRCMSLCGLDEQSALNRANYSARGSNASSVSGMSADTSDVNGTRNANIVLVNPSVPVFEVDQLAQAVDADATFSKDIATVFNYDSCIWSAGDGIVGRPSKHADQAEVHAVIGKRIVNDALNGLSSVCFAYGEERSGKSHSLFGPSPVSARAPAAAVSGGLGGGLTSSMSFPSLATLQEADRGLIPRVFSDILKGINFQDTKCTLAFVEIYNEKIHDLLGGAGNGSASTAQQLKGVPAATRGGVADAVRRGPGGARSTGAGVPVHATEKHVNSLFYRSTHHRKHNVRIELKVREHPLLGPYVDGMRKVRVRTEDDMYAIIQEAQQEKSYLHKANGSKANYGTVLCTLELTPLHDVGGHAKSKGGLQHGQKAVRVHMVDLAAAPSESLSNWRTSVKTASKASHLQEKARVINITMSGNSSVNIPKAADEVKVVRKSLSHLNYVLHSMERGAQMHALPFRDSCLTWLLRSTLTLPSSRITLLAHASPGDRSFDETSKTLKYAERLCLARDNHHRVHRFRQEDAKWVNGASLAPTAGSRTNATAIGGATPRAKAISHAKAFSTSSKAPKQSAPTNEKSAAQNSVYQRQSPTTNNSNNFNPAKVGSGSATISQQPHRFSADEELTLARADRDALLNTLPSPPTGSSTEDVAAPALVTASAADTQQVTMLKTTVLALQQALEGSIHEKNVLKAENDALRARISSGTTAADFSLACLERADAWRSRANSSNNNNNGEITSNEEEVQVARADVIAAHEALAAFQLDAQAQLQSLWTAVQELNKLDKQKEQAINDIVIERGTLKDNLKKARIKQGELEAELHMMDTALVEAAEEAVSRMEAPRSQSKSPGVRSSAYTNPPRTDTGTANSSDEKHSSSKNKNNSSRPDAFTYRIAEGPPESPDVYTFSTASEFSPTRSSGSGSNDNTPKVTRPFNNSEEGDASAQAIAATDDDIEASPLEDMPEEELDEQIAKLSKFLVKDRRLLKMQRAQQARTP